MGDKNEVITSQGHPVMRLIKRFQKQLTMILISKIDKEIMDFKEHLVLVNKKLEGKRDEEIA